MRFEINIESVAYELAIKEAPLVVFVNETKLIFIVCGTQAYKIHHRAPEWRSGLRHCIAVLEASLQTLV